MNNNAHFSRSLAETITKSASRQTYYTIRLLVDCERIADAFRAYGYFRWVDDVLDAEAGSMPEKLAFIHRQQSLLDACYRGEKRDGLCHEEGLLVELIRSDVETNSGLQAYLSNMMGVMDFDAGRRGRVITQAELTEYSRMLATAVTEALYYFIGHNDPVPDHPARYLAVTAAHITHMLRDTIEDNETGYFNIPLEYLRIHRISAGDVENPWYQKWVRSRVQLAYGYFKEGRRFFGQVKNLRRRLAGYAYIARFEWMLRVIEADDYCLRREYPQRKELMAGLWMGWSALTSLFTFPRIDTATHNQAMQPVRKKKR
ncbi:MAG TPA: squalene/phytoene synthase family protein [Levilinea sp.]|nr:squalene/phytoene synthase family protein [Levilinea sp.]